MTHLSHLHQFNEALQALLPVLFARYKALSHPDSDTDIMQDEELSRLVKEVQQLQSTRNQLTIDQENQTPQSPDLTQE